MHFFLITQGWLGCKVKDNNGNEFNITHSEDYGNVFQELIDKIMFLNEVLNKQEIYYFPYTFMVNFCDDILNHSVYFSMNSLKSDLNIKIVADAVNNSNYSKFILEKNVDFSVFLVDVFNSLESMLNNFGLIGYKKVWEVGNFPISEYLELKASILNLNLASFLGDEDWRLKIPLEQEIYILSSKLASLDDSILKDE